MREGMESSRHVLLDLGESGAAVQIHMDARSSLPAIPGAL